MIFLVIAFFLVFLAVCLGLVVLGTLQKSRLGINLAKTPCARCGAPMPTIRKPANLRQALWGGWTCPQCGTENDKWGRPVRL